MKRKSLISIIIPIYNAEKYLNRCIKSILNQSHNNLEIILVNDGSEDDSLNICNDYAKRDSRIKVIHKDNAGPSAAREDGVNMATGNFIAFVDADDYIDKDMYQSLIRVANNGVDIVQCGYRRVSTTGEILETRELKQIDISGSFESSLHYASQTNTTNFLWNKLYKAKLFKKVVFPKLYAGEDSCILTQVYTFAKRIVNIEEPFYNYVMTPDSLCRQPFSEKKLDNIEAGKFMYDFYSRNFPKLCGFSALHICSYSAKLYCEIIEEDINLKQEKIKYLLENFNMFYNPSRDRMSRNMSSKKRVFFVELFKKSPKISILIYKLFLKM